MNTINEPDFRRICEQVHEQEGVSIRQRTASSSERTRLLLEAVFLRICHHLGLDAEAQKTELHDADGFALLQTLEEHMDPEFFYSAILDRYLLFDV